MTRKIFLLLLILSAATIGNAQFLKSIAPSPEFSKNLEEIVLDFRKNFETIRGENLTKDGDVESYASIVQLPGATNCVVYQYRSKQDTTASWQATMYKGDDFKEAAKAYENCVKLVKKTQVRWIDASPVGFSGEMVRPSEDVRFVVSTLQLKLNDLRYKHFVAEVEMISTYDSWEVHINLQTRKPDDAARY